MRGQCDLGFSSPARHACGGGGQPGIQASTGGTLPVEGSCPLREASLSPRDGRTKILQPPEEPPKICRQTAITIARDTSARYATLRNTTEGLNSYAKDTAHQALGQPGRRRVRGIAALSVRHRQFCR
jgi:hypothetical protein